MWIRPPKHEWPKSWSSVEDPVVPIERNLYGHPLAELLWERQFEKVLSEHGWEKVFNWECLFVNRARGQFLSVHVDDIKLAGKKQITPIRLGNSHERRCFGRTNIILFDLVYLGCTQRECQISKDIMDNERSMLESRMSAGAMETYQKQKPRGNLMPKRHLHGPMTWKVMQ